MSQFVNSKTTAAESVVVDDAAEGHAEGHHLVVELNGSGVVPFIESASKIVTIVFSWLNLLDNPFILRQCLEPDLILFLFLLEL